MTKAQNAERSHRFKIAFKISLPFILSTMFFCYIFFSKDSITGDDIILFTILTLLYVYFTTYMIYQSFKSSVIDGISQVFNRQKIVEILNKRIKKADENQSLVLINLKNVTDISDRYGFDFGDTILRKTIEKLIRNLQENGIKNSVVGRYTDRYFLLFAPVMKPKISHILTSFSKKIQNEGIDFVEVLIEFAIIPANHSKNIKSSINFLSNELNGNTYNYDDLDKYENDVCKNIAQGNFIFKTQKVASLAENNDMFSVIATLKTNNFGNISKANFTDIANKNGYEITLDKQIFSLFLKKIGKKSKDKFLIEISPVTIRNSNFLNFIKDLVFDDKINPKNFIFEFSESEIYTHTSRFNEILKEYKNLGFGIAVTHFGGKNGLFSYFLTLEIDYIIYDIFFSKNYRNPKIATTFLKFNEICKNLGIKSVMKFVERAEILEFATANKVDFVQGFFIEKPKEIKG